jgi:hypothetical protein
VEAEVSDIGPDRAFNADELDNLERAVALAWDALQARSDEAEDVLKDRIR